MKSKKPIFYFPCPACTAKWGIEDLKRFQNIIKNYGKSGIFCSTCGNTVYIPRSTLIPNSLYYICPEK